MNSETVTTIALAIHSLENIIKNALNHPELVIDHEYMNMIVKSEMHRRRIIESKKYDVTEFQLDGNFIVSLNLAATKHYFWTSVSQVNNELKRILENKERIRVIDSDPIHKSKSPEMSFIELDFTNVDKLINKYESFFKTDPKS